MRGAICAHFKPKERPKSPGTASLHLCRFEIMIVDSIEPRASSYR